MNHDWLKLENIEKIKEYCKEILDKVDDFDLTQSVDIECTLYWDVIKWIKDYEENEKEIMKQIREKIK